MPGRVLIVHQGALGDLIAVLPVFDRIRDTGAAVDAAVDSRFGPLLRRLAGIGRHVPTDAGAFSSLYGGAVDARVAADLDRYDGVLVFAFADTLAASIRRYWDLLWACPC